MTAVVKKAKKRKQSGSADDSLKPFNVVSGKLKLRFIPDTGGFAVVGIGMRGLNTQGDTFEEALANAHDAAKLLEECEKETRFAPISEQRKITIAAGAENDVRKNPAFGMWRDREEFADPAAFVRTIRRGRDHAL